MDANFVEEMNKINSGEYRVRDNTLHIVADTVSIKQLTYMFPFCLLGTALKKRFSGLHPKISKYKKDGNPYKNAYRVTHYHGSNYTIQNSTHFKHVHHTSRVGRKCDYVIIYVTNKTIRV